MQKQQINEEVRRIIHCKRDEIARTLSELVQIPSEIGQEGKAQKYMQELYASAGLKVVTFEPDIKKLKQHQAFVHPDAPLDRFKGRPDVLGILEGDPGEKSLKLNAHVDVVPPGEASDWEFSPWSGKVVGDRLYGRGARDDKGGLIANFYALKSLMEAGVKPKGTVMLESVVEEEDFGGGSLGSLLEGYLTDGTIVSDEGPASAVIIAHAGLNYCKIRVEGVSAHAGRAEFGVSALLKMNKICQALAELDEQRGHELQYPLFLQTGKKVVCNLVIGTYRAGHWRASVPGWAEIECRIGSIPGETTEAVRAQVEGAVRQVADADDWLRTHRPVITWTCNGVEPWEQDRNHLFVRKYHQCVADVLGTEPLVTGMSASTDARFTQYFGIPAIVTGPTGGNIHAPNEYVDLSSVFTLAEILAVFIWEWCGTESE